MDKFATSVVPANPPAATTGPYIMGAHYMPYWTTDGWSIVPADRTPLKGRYDESLQSTTDQQLGEMRSFGFDYVSLITFWNNESGTPHADYWAQHYLTSATNRGDPANPVAWTTGSPKPRFSLMWDNTFTYSTHKSFVQMMTYFAATYCGRADAQLHRGKVLFTVYEPEILKTAAGGTDAAVKAWLDEARTIGNFFILCSTTGAHLYDGPGSAKAMGFDGVTTYNLVTGGNWAGMQGAYAKWWLTALTICPLPVLLPISAGWDNSAQTGGVAIANPSAPEFESGVRQSIAFNNYNSSKVIGHIVNSWNEHSEGSVVEPATWIGGTARGLALKRAFGK